MARVEQLSKLRTRGAPKRQCRAWTSGHPDLAARAGALDSRLRGNDKTSKDLILNDAPHFVGSEPDWS